HRLDGEAAADRAQRTRGEPYGVMSVVALAVLACATIATGFQVFQVVAAWRFLRRARRFSRGGPLPPVTVLKPLKGPGVELYENLASFCRQSYPSYQIVFGVEDPHDPAVAVVQRLRREFPERDIVLAVGVGRGTNRKVANLEHMMPHARHDVLVMSDSDIRVRPDYLADDYQLGRRVADAGYGLVLLPYVVETVLDSVTLRDVWRHQVRWARTYRVCQPVGWFCSVVTHATLWGLLAAGVIGGTVGLTVMASALVA